MMMSWGWGFGIFGMILMLLFWIVLIVAAVWVVRALFGNGRQPSQGPAGLLSAREILEQRYARGEITREQYEMMKKDIE